MYNTRTVICNGHSPVPLIALTGNGNLACTRMLTHVDYRFTDAGQQLGLFRSR
ncbi:hypothetical protein D3C81_1892070 [compost metagenome]